MLTVKRQIGNLGEDIAVRYLRKQGYKILERNWRKKWGEIDIIALKQKEEIIFIEVKTGIWAEENLTFKKRRNLLKTTRNYLLEKYGNENIDWQFDIILVSLDAQKRKAQIRHLQDVNI
jgi:putative endonuclease